MLPPAAAAASPVGRASRGAASVVESCSGAGAVPPVASVEPDAPFSPAVAAPFAPTVAVVPFPAPLEAPDFSPVAGGFSCADTGPVNTPTETEIQSACSALKDQCVS